MCSRSQVSDSALAKSVAASVYELAATGGRFQTGQWVDCRTTCQDEQAACWVAGRITAQTAGTVQVQLEPFPAVPGLEAELHEAWRSLSAAGCVDNLLKLRKGDEVVTVRKAKPPLPRCPAADALPSCCPTPACPCRAASSPPVSQGQQGEGLLAPLGSFSAMHGFGPLPGESLGWGRIQLPVLGIPDVPGFLASDGREELVVIATMAGCNLMQAASALAINDGSIVDAILVCVLSVHAALMLLRLVHDSMTR